MGQDVELQKLFPKGKQAPILIASEAILLHSLSLFVFLPLF